MQRQRGDLSTEPEQPSPIAPFSVRFERAPDPPIERPERPNYSTGVSHQSRVPKQIQGEHMAREKKKWQALHALVGYKMAKAIANDVILWAKGPLPDYLLHEWEYGGYERELELPSGFAGGVEATLTNGQLAVRVLRGTGSDDVTVQPTG